MNEIKQTIQEINRDIEMRKLEDAYITIIEQVNSGAITEEEYVRKYEQLNKEADRLLEV